MSNLALKSAPYTIVVTKVDKDTGRDTVAATIPCDTESNSIYVFTKVAEEHGFAIDDTDVDNGYIDDENNVYTIYRITNQCLTEYAIKKTVLTETKTDTHHYFKDKDGKMQGEYKWWDDNGQLREHCFFKDGKYHSEYKWWYSNGQLVQHCFYKDSKLQGEHKWWNSDGQLREHCFHNNDIKVIDFADTPELYPVTEEDKTALALKYNNAKFL